jgi:hypothetical protein
MKKITATISLSLLTMVSVCAQDGTTGTTVKTDNSGPSKSNFKKINVIAGNGYKLGFFTSTYGSNQLEEGDYKGSLFSVGFPINVNFRKYLGFTFTPGLFTVNSEVKNPSYTASYGNSQTQFFQFDMFGFNLPAGVKINLMGDYLAKGEFSLVGGVNLTYLLKARDESADMLTGTPAYPSYGYLGPDEKFGMGYFGGIQFSKNSGLLTIRYEDMGLNNYNQNYQSPYTDPSKVDKVAMKNTVFTISYAILFGAAKRIKRTNEILKGEGKQPLSEKRGIF